MGCFGADREKQLRKEHQWDYFNLSDFKSNSCWAGFTYGILYITLIISVACYVLDILTCSQLIMSDKWQGQIEITPIVPFEIARWIFTGCILLSFVFLAYRWWKAIRAIKSGSVAASYLDPLAVRIESIRFGQAQGWRRFLVFAELTKSKKGAEYVALFSYFSFEAALRILLAEGPRQVINGLTIYSIMRTSVIPLDGTKAAAPKGTSPVVQFFLNVKILGAGNNLRLIVFFGMLFTVLVWIIAFLSLISACILYVMFLWHHIPKRDGGLSGYCKRKVDSKLQSIVDAKIKKAFEKEEKMRLKAEAKAAKSGQPIQGLKKQPTLPVLTSSEDRLPNMPTISRQPTLATLSEYESRPETPSQGQTMYSDNFSRPGMPSRTTTGASDASYASSNAPLMGGAAAMGYSQPRPYTPSQMSVAGSSAGGPPPLGRSLTGQSQASQGSFPFPQQQPNSRMAPPSRQNTNQSFGPDRQFTPAPSMRSYTPMGDPRSNTPMGDPRSNTPMSDPRFGPPRRQNTNEFHGGYLPQSDRSDTSSIISGTSSFGRRGPGSQGGSARAEQGIEMQQRAPPVVSHQPFRPYSPALSAPGQGPRIPFGGAPPRNFSSPVDQHASSNSFDRSYAPPRSGTAPPQSQYPASGYDQFEARPGPPTRSNTAGPSYDQWPQHGL